MVRVQATIEIKKSAGEVFATISDVEKFPFWTSISRVEHVSGTGEVGTTYNLIRSTIFRKKVVPIEITQKRYPMVFAYRDNSLTTENETGFLLKEEEGKTTVTAYVEIGIGVVAFLFSLNFLAIRDIEQELKKSLVRLKELLGG